MLSCIRFASETGVSVGNDSHMLNVRQVDPSLRFHCASKVYERSRGLSKEHSRLKEGDYIETVNQTAKENSLKSSIDRYNSPGSFRVIHQCT